MNILLANPRGFCAGVDRAIEIVEKALEHFGAPIYVRHEVVHNRHVVDGLRARGAIFVENLEEIPTGSIVIFSAHGVSKQIREQAQAREFTVFDATCPLVTKVHMEVARLSRQAIECILIGHAGHPEVEGTLGQYTNPDSKVHLIQNEEDARTITVSDPTRLCYVTQTTLSIDETATIVRILQERFPLMTGPKKNDICYATQNRQDAVALLAKQADVILVVGSITSSNSNRLRELAEKLGAKSYLIDDASEVQAEWLEGAKTIGITAGASAPEILVQSLITHLKTHYLIEKVEVLQGAEETVSFNLPKNLRQIIDLETTA
jgi:4-hydroxy-3-methylbut-2-enyl diphosphate reductase